jgi:hypothetical protein
MMEHYDDYDIDESEIETWKRDFQDVDIDGSYCSINRMEELLDE